MKKKKTIYDVAKALNLALPQSPKLKQRNCQFQNEGQGFGLCEKLICDGDQRENLKAKYS